MTKASATSALELRDFLPFRLSVLSNAVSRRIADLYDREFGLTVWQWRVMAVCADAPGISATDIGQRTQMDKVAVSRAVAGLLERDFLDRAVAPDDGRRTLLDLSEKGRKIYDTIVPLALAEEARLLAALSDQEASDLARLMEKLARVASPDRKLW